jgi:hypothetical protein
MIALSSFPRGDPDATSSRNKSPEDRCVKPYFWTMRSHWVPLPQPGPPGNHKGIARRLDSRQHDFFKNDMMTMCSNLELHGFTLLQK